jgi:hypothetical protein
MARLWLLLSVWACAAVPASAASPDPRDLAVPPHELSRAQSLVRQLSSVTFRDRERAQRELAAMGRLARPVLADAAQTDPDPEVRFRCARLLPKATADDLKARTDAFLADAEGKFEHDLPGWKRFREIAGADQPARDLFVALLKSAPNGELLAALDRPIEEAGRAVADRRNQMYSQIYQRQLRVFDPASPPPSPTLTDIAALLVAETVVPSKNVPRAGQFGFSVSAANFVQQPASLAAVASDTAEHAAAYRRVLGRWFDTRTDVTDLSHYALVSAAHSLPTVKETTPLMRRAAQTDGVQPHIKAQAMLHLVQRHDKEELAVLKSQLTNDGLISQQRLGLDVTLRCQVRDVALALSVHLSGQDVRDYGFEFVNGFNAGQVTTNYYGYGFTTDEKRDAAFRKWREWEASPRKK